MKLTYCIPAKTVCLELTPAELFEMGDEARNRVRGFFREMVSELKGAGVEVRKAVRRR